MAIRTKLLLALAAVAIGAAGAAIFLSLEANRTSASQEELVELRDRVELLEEQAGAAPTSGEIDAATEEAESAAGAAEGAAEEAESAAEGAGAAERDAAAADEAAERAAGAAGDEAGAAAGAADEAGRSADDAAAAEGAIRNRTEPVPPGTPPLPEIGTNRP